MNFWSSPTLSSLHAHASARFQVHPPIQLQPSPVFVLEFFEQAHLHLSKQPIVKDLREQRHSSRRQRSSHSSPGCAISTSIVSSHPFVHHESTSRTMRLMPLSPLLTPRWPQNSSGANWHLWLRRPDSGFEPGAIRFLPELSSCWSQCHVQLGFLMLTCVLLGNQSASPNHKLFVGFATVDSTVRRGIKLTAQQHNPNPACAIYLISRQNVRKVHYRS